MEFFISSIESIVGEQRSVGLSVGRSVARTRYTGARALLAQMFVSDSVHSDTSLPKRAYQSTMVRAADANAPNARSGQRKERAANGLAMNKASMSCILGQFPGRQVEGAPEMRGCQGTKMRWARHACGAKRKHCSLQFRLCNACNRQS